MTHGAEVRADGAVRFRLWAPEPEHVSVLTEQQRVGGRAGQTGGRGEGRKSSWGAYLLTARLAARVAVFAYFNNDVDGHAIENARSRARLVGRERWS